MNFTAASGFTPVTVTPQSVRDVFHEGRIGLFRQDPHPQTFAARLAELLNQRLRQLDAMLELARVDADTQPGALDVEEFSDYLRSCRYASTECVELSAQFLTDPSNTVEDREASAAETANILGRMPAATADEITIGRAEMLKIKRALLAGLTDASSKEEDYAIALHHVVTALERGKSSDEESAGE